MCRLEIRLSDVVNQRFDSVFKMLLSDNISAVEKMNFEISYFDSTPPRNFHFTYRILQRMVFSCLQFSITAYILNALLT